MALPEVDPPVSGWLQLILLLSIYQLCLLQSRHLGVDQTACTAVVRYVRSRLMCSMTDCQRQIDLSMKIPSNHSLVNIPFLPSSPAPMPKTATIASLISPGADIPRSGIPVKSPSPTRSRPSSPKTRTGTLKKRPMSLHASRPGSWHVDSPLGSSSIKAKKSGKGKRSSALIEEEGGGSSNDVS